MIKLKLNIFILNCRICYILQRSVILKRGRGTTFHPIIEVQQYWVHVRILMGVVYQLSNYGLLKISRSSVNIHEFK